MFRSAKYIFCKSSSPVIITLWEVFKEIYNIVVFICNLLTQRTGKDNRSYDCLILKSFERMDVPANGWASRSNGWIVFNKRVSKSFERLDVFIERVSKSFERMDAFTKRVSKSFERLDVSVERVIKPFERMQIFLNGWPRSFERMQISFKRLSNGF